MARDVNIEIKLKSGDNLDYISPEDLGIKLNRIADDYTKPDKRFGEFSYSFTVPQTKNNNKIFSHANTFSNSTKFKNTQISASLYNSDKLLLEGKLELVSIGRDNYECRFYSQLTELVDDFEDLNLRDITNMPQISNWNYETTIKSHVESNYANSDEANYQFPLVFYNTFFTPFDVYNGQTDFDGYEFPENGDRPQQNYYYLLNRTTSGDNELFFQWFPLCFYLKFIIEKLFATKGWSVGGSFFDDDNFKKIIMTYVGESDVYDRAVYTRDSITYLNTGEFLPDLDALSFVSSIINTFNLYFIIDSRQRVINFETYDVMFGSKSNPIDITNKVLYESVKITNELRNDPSILFKEPLNSNILCDNYYISGDTLNAYNVSYVKTSNSKFNGIFNHIGTTDDEINVGFASPNVKRMYLRNNDNYLNTISTAGDHIIFIPNSSEQTYLDNGNKPFNKSTGDTIVNNTEDKIKYKGDPMLMYYYGISDSTIIQRIGKGNQSNYFYVDFDDDKMKFGFASPFALSDYRAVIDSQLNSGDSGSTASLYASYLQSIYLMMANSDDTVSDTTDYSLIFGDNHGMISTIYTKFHGNKYKRLQEGEILEADMIMDDITWERMKLNTPVLYDGVIWSLVGITNYDVVKGMAKIKLIKQL